MSHPPDPYPVTSPYAPPPRGRPIWAFVVTAAMLAVAGGLALWRVSPLSDPTTFTPSANTPMTLPAPTLDKPQSHHSGPTLLYTHRASGPRWTMQIPRKWTAIDIPNTDEQAAWRTPGGVGGHGDFVSVLHDTSGASFNLHTYVMMQRNLLAVGISTASHLHKHIANGRGELTYNLLMSGNPARAFQLMVPTATGHATALFIAPASTYSHDIKKAKRYLETLTGR